VGVAAPLVLDAQEAGTIAFRASFGGAVSPGQLASTGKADFVGRVASVDRAVAALERLGHVQIDTISVVERAHHHILWSRDREYRSSVLPTLEAEPRRAFEYWAHAAAYLPLSDYRYCLPRMRRIAAQGHEWFPSDRRVVDWVRDRIRAEGPLRSQDFAGDGPRGPWWDWKPAKAALEYLFQSGELMVAARPGFQKLYDLAERVLPADTDTSFPSEDEMGDWYVRQAASALGVFTLRDIAYQRKDTTAGIARALDKACEEGRLQPCVVRESSAVAAGPAGNTGKAGGGGNVGKGGSFGKAGAGGQFVRSWCDSGLLSRYAGCGAPESGDGDSGGGEDRPVRILSPFDNLIINRKRASRLFGLDYTLECYVPAAKRRFGYFGLPVFYQGRPVGLLDCKADRKNNVLIINRAVFGWGADPAESPAGFAEAFAVELASFTVFNGCIVSR